MREMNPINSQSDDQLSKALQRLATASRQQGAPPELGEMLKGEFHRRHVRRRRTRMIGLIGMAACLSIFALLLLSRKSPVSVPDVKNPVETTRALQPSQSQGSLNQGSLNRGPLNHGSQNPVEPTPGPTAATARAQRARPVTPEPADDEFFALPSYDPAMTANDWQIVRLELTGAELRMVGAPVTEELADRRVRADFLIGRDGTPYGVRLVP
jgi:hypothetical protein